jgi:hypothetical protein
VDPPVRAAVPDADTADVVVPKYPAVPFGTVLEVLIDHEYPEGAIPVDGAVQLIDQEVKLVIVRVTPVAGLGIPNADVFETAKLEVDFVVFDA